MNLRLKKRSNSALTIVEVLFIVVVLILLVVTFLPLFSRARIRGGHNCITNLMQIDLSFNIWAGDNNNKFPKDVSVANGGAMELVATGNAAGCFLVISNELNTPKILVCPADFHRTAATNFGNDFNNSHISYLIDIDAATNYPHRLLCGDDNFEVGGSPIKSGVALLSTNMAVIWGPGRHGDVPVHHFWTKTPHHFVGNLGFADGRVTEAGDDGLQSAIQQAGLTTNRFAIP